MARIRTVKPEYWTSTQVMNCSRDARLLFIGLWNFCDDHGVHPYSLKTIKAQIFPGDEDVTSDTIRRLIAEIVATGLLLIFEHDATSYLLVTGWKHQKIDKPSYKYPTPPTTYARVVDQSSNGSPNVSRLIADRSTPIHPAERKGEDRIGMEGIGASPLPPSSDPWREITAAFDEATAEVFGPAIAIADPEGQDGSFAKLWFELGLRRDDAKRIFRTSQTRKNADGGKPITSLKYFDNPVRDHLAKPIANSAEPAPTKPTPISDVEVWRIRLNGLVNRGVWIPKWGDQPNLEADIQTTGVDCPATIIREFRGRPIPPPLNQPRASEPTETVVRTPNSVAAIVG